MFRLALTYQLILAVAVGPLLCCCSAGRLVAATAPQPVIPTEPAPTHRAPAPCCAHKHQPAPVDAPRDDGGKSPAAPKPADKCPCKDGSSKDRTDQTETFSTDVAALLRTLSLDLVASALLLEHPCDVADAGADPGGTRGSSAAPLSTADLLFAHHNLRC